MKQITSKFKNVLVAALCTATGVSASFGFVGCSGGGVMGQRKSL